MIPIKKPALLRAPFSCRLIGCRRRDHRGRPGRSCRPDGSCLRQKVCPVRGHRHLLRHRDCHSSQGRDHHHRVLALGAVGDNHGRHHRHHSSDLHRRRSRAARNQGRHSLAVHRRIQARSNAVAARSIGVVSSSVAPSNNVGRSSKPRSRHKSRSALPGDSCHTRIRCCSRCCRPAACKSQIRNSLRNIRRETTSSIR
jgi:hypothetical protein